MAKKVSKQSKRRLMTMGVLSVMGITYFLITFFGYAYRYFSLKKEEAELNQELLSLQEQKDNLKIEITKLNDPNYVARYAKEKYLYSSSGEYVIKIEEDKIENEILDKKNNNIIYIISGSFIIFLVIIIKKKK